MADIFEELLGQGGDASALINALRKQRDIGTVGALSGNKQIAALGGQLANQSVAQATGLRESRDLSEAKAAQRELSKWQQEQAAADRKAQRDYQYAALAQARALQEAQMANARDIAGMRAGASGAGLSPFDRRRQQEIATESVQWDTRGAPMAQSNLTTLVGAYQDLAADKSVGSELLPAMIPDNVRALYNKKGLDLQQRINSVTVQNLRDAFGPQFTQKENEQFRALEYDPALSNAQNLKKLEKKIEMIQGLIAAKERTFGEFRDPTGGVGQGDSLDSFYGN